METDDAPATDPVCQRTDFLWDGDVLLAESAPHSPDAASPDPLSVVYLHEPGSFRPLAQVRRSGGPDQQPQVYHYHLDHLGTPQELTNDNGELVWQAEYRAWGALAKLHVAEVENPLRFQGQYHDPETGLHYNRHRYYAPNEGCFTTQDPIRLAGGSNLAAYAPNPVEWVDPLGLMPWAWNPNGMGHHLVYRNKANSAGLTHLGTAKDTPTFFPSNYEPGMHEAIHRAQDPYVGGRQGTWTGTPDELLEASRKGLGDVAEIRGDLKVPRTGEILARDVTPEQAYDKLMDWHKEKTTKSSITGGRGCKF